MTPARLGARAWAGWASWAFGPVDPAPMAALRVLVGLLTVGWTLSLLPDAGVFLSGTGLVPGLPASGGGGAWAVTVPAPFIILGVLLVASVGLTVGYRTRPCAVAVAVLLLVVQRRDPYVLNSGDLLLREMAFFVALMPSGEVWSFDARRRGQWRARAPWALRLLQLQVSAAYLFSVTAKLRGGTWNSGTAVGIAVQLEDLQRLAIPQQVAQSLTFSALASYATLVVEGALVVGLWLPRARWAVMAAGVAVHLGIEATLLIGWFSLAIIACYVAFVPPPVLRRVVAGTGRRVVEGTGRRLGGRHRVTAADGAATCAPGPAPPLSS